MDRRKFLRLSTSVTAAGMIQSHAAPLLNSVNAKSRPRDMTAVEFHAARRFVRTAQGRIAYFERGTGPVALFLHGFPLNSFQLRGVIPWLAQDRRCIAPDCLALGYTEVASGQSVTPAVQVDMLAELLGKLSIVAVDLIANDSGGAVA